MGKGFSLSELILALLIAGVVAALTIPVVNQSMGDSNGLLFKSAFKTVENVVSDLISDTDLYPDGNFYNATSPNGTAFCTNFAARVNTIGSTPQCNVANPSTALGTNISSSTANFTTTNGMRWYGFNGLFGTATSPVTILVDVDGSNNGNSIVGQDVLRIQIENTGKMSVPTEDAGLEDNYLTE